MGSPRRLIGYLQMLSGGDSFLKFIPKEKRHRFKLWKSNDELPKLSNITNIPDYLPNSEVEGV